MDHTDFLHTLCADYRIHNSLKVEARTNSHILRGLRYDDGTGVMVGCTKVGNVQGYRMVDGEKEPMEGNLQYRGYALKDLVKIRTRLNLPCQELQTQIRLKSEALRSRWFDAARGVYVDGEKGSLSWASQIWVILAGIATEEEGSRLLETIAAIPEATRAVTPYLYHHYIHALILCGQPRLAYEKMNTYWGGMLARGADTFWEIYDPQNPDVSPYGGKIIHSFCHAWSCTPTYFLRTHFCFKENT